MNKFNTTVALLAALSTLACQQGTSQSYRMVGGPCEGCEAVLEFDREPGPVDTLPGFGDKGTQIKITGTIYRPDAKTPAEGVILYVYHTNQEGLYAADEDASGWAKRHGRIRGWVKTGKDGRYTFYTLWPGTYPDRSEPAHIHPTIFEPGGKYYWTDSFLFKGDPLIREKDEFPVAPRCGSSGVMQMRKDGDLLVGERDFVLGKNIPGYEK